MKIKGFLLIGLAMVSALFVSAQTPEITITYSGPSELLLNEISVNKKMTVEKLITALGEPSKTENYTSGEISYFYEESGLVFFTQSESVKGIGINFNWDGDDKFPEATFSGILFLGELEVTQETKSESIAEIEQVEFTCPFPMMCASADRDAKINCTVAFKDENLTQVVFLIK